MSEDVGAVDADPPPGDGEGSTDGLKESVSPRDCVISPLVLAAALSLGAPDALPQLVLEGRAESEAVDAKETVANEEKDRKLPLGTPVRLPLPPSVALLPAVSVGPTDSLKEGCTEGEPLGDEEKIKV